jgi:hypothetical protein
MPIQLNSQPDGIYRTIALPPGSYKVQTISNPTDMSEAQTVLLESGKEFRLDLKVAKAQ